MKAETRKLPFNRFTLRPSTPDAWSRIARCRALPPPSDAELAKMVSEFHQRGGAITKVAPAYLVATTSALGTNEGAPT